MSGLNSPCLAACRRLSLLAFALVLVKNVIRVVPRVPLGDSFRRTSGTAIRRILQFLSQHSPLKRPLVNCGRLSGVVYVLQIVPKYGHKVSVALYRASVTFRTISNRSHDDVA